MHCLFASETTLHPFSLFSFNILLIQSLGSVVSVSICTLITLKCAVSPGSIGGTATCLTVGFTGDIVGLSTDTPLVSVIRAAIGVG